MLKATVPPPLRTIGAVDQALGLVADLEAGADRERADLEARIANLRAEAARRIEPRVRQAKTLRTKIEKWAEGNRDAFAGARSMDLTHGRIGWRWTPPAIRLTKTADTVIAALESRGLADAVITKKSVNKDVLAAYPDARLAEIGAKRTSRDEFYIDLADEDAAGRAAATA